MSPYWQSYWYQVMFTEDRNPGWKPLHGGPLHRGRTGPCTVPYLSSETREVPRISYYRPSSEADLGSETKFHDGLS